MFAVEFVLGNLFIIYTVILHILSPGTFLDILTSFSNIWAVSGICLIVFSVYRIKHGYSFWSRIQKKWKRVIVGFAGVCGLIAAINLFFILTPKILHQEKIDSQSQIESEMVSEKNPDEAFFSGRTFVFLLGGGIDKNGKLPNPVLWRIQKAADYMKQNPEAVCVVTGGTLKWLPYPEAPELKRQLVRRGISEDRILVEDQAQDTIENLQLGVKLFSETYGLEIKDILESPVILVSSRYHLRRAQRLARRIGFEKVTGLGARTPVFHIPMSYLREICAYVKLNARILLTGKPVRLE